MEKTILDGRYRIERKLGDDGLGEVYLAHDHAARDHSSPAAVKVLHSSANHHTRRKFRLAWEALSRIRHPHVAGLLGAGTLADDRPWFAMEYVTGLSLREALARYGPTVRLEWVGRWVRQLGQALAAAHAVGVVHHDLKPENVQLAQAAEEEYFVKLIDFGVAKVETALPVITYALGPVETALYMSPEQIKGEPVTAASNIYTLGVLAYELLTGRLPFPAPKEPKRRYYRLLERQELGSFQRLGLICDGLPDGVCELVCQSLAYEPERRPASAALFGEEFERLLLGKAGGGLKTPTDPPRRQQAFEYKEPGGALGLESQLYITRAADRELTGAIRRRDGVILIEGGRQVGKTSLLARGLHEARQSIEGVRVALTDFQKLSEAELASAEKFFEALGGLLADALGIDADPETGWQAQRGAALNFEHFLKLEILAKLTGPLVWGMDEVDRLFGRAYASEVFGLFRAWYNERNEQGTEPDCPWRRLTIIMSYATEAHLLIADMNQSPFNVGTRLRLCDFSLEQVAELNQRYGIPVAEEALGRLYELIGGHPYLTQKGLYEIARGRYTLEEILARSDADEGPFHEHLRRVWLSVQQQKALQEGVRMILEGNGKGVASEVFYRLRSGGVVVGESPERARLRCRLYERYLRRRLEVATSLGL